MGVRRKTKSKPAQPRGERAEQKARTRQALIDAGLELLRAGTNPNLSEVAAQAGVSVATAYRHFPSAPALWDAVGEQTGAPEPSKIFANADGLDVQERVELLLRKVGGRYYQDEAVWRTALASLVGQRGDAGARRGRLARPSGRRLRWIDAALEPLEGTLPAPALRRLRMALALVFGTESMVTLRDICGLSVKESREVSAWAARALVAAALKERDKGGRRRG